MSLRIFALAVALAGGSILLPAQRQAAFTLPANVDVVPDLVYAAYGEKQLRLDLYLPKPRPAKPMPGIVVIRGGGWRQGDKKGFAPIAAGLAANGLAAACIEYRVLPQASFPDPVYDTKAAVRWMRAEGQRYGIAANAIGAIGGSAGGHLAALLGTSYKVRALEGAGGHAGISSRVQAVVAMAPVVNFLSMAKARQRGGEATRGMFGEGTEMPKLLSPVTHVDRDAAPILLLHSNADQTVPFSQSQEMLERYRQAGVRAELVTMEGAPHAFWNQSKWAAETLEKSARFFHSVLDGAAATAQELVPESIQAGGVTRTYRYYAPPKPAGKLPLVFVLHGAGGTSERLAPIVGFEKLAAAKGFIVVYPDAFEKHWNDLRGIPEWTSHQRNIDDVGFFSALIDRFVSRHNADPKRVFVTGISNGGLMSHRLGCELAHKIAAVAPVVRTLTTRLAEGCKPARPIPVHMFFGTADKLVPFQGGIQKMGSAETPVLSAQQTIDRWAALNGCSKAASVTRSAAPAGSRQVFSGCRQGAEVVAYIRDGAGHSWPPDATGLIWAFFEKHPLP